MSPKIQFYHLTIEPLFPAASQQASRHSRAVRSRASNSWHRTAGRLLEGAGATEASLQPGLRQAAVLRAERVPAMLQ